MDSGFIWKDKNCKDFGLVVESGLDKPGAEANIEKTEIPGRDGTITIDRGTLKPFPLNVTFHLVDETHIDKVKEWLSGTGKLILLNNGDGYYMASIISQLDLEELVPTLHKGIVQFECEPCKNLFEGEKTITLTQAREIYNVGTYNSKPYIKIYGSGTITLNVNDNELTIKNVSNYVEIDSFIDKVFKDTEDKDDDSVGLTPTFQTGYNSISWTGNVQKIEIIPRWRCR